MFEVYDTLGNLRMSQTSKTLRIVAAIQAPVSGSGSLSLPGLLKGQPAAFMITDDVSPANFTWSAAGQTFSWSNGGMSGYIYVGVR